VTYTLYLDVSADSTRVDFHVPETGGIKEEPPTPIPRGARRVRVEIDIPHPYRAENLMAYIEEVGHASLLHLPPSLKGDPQ
jgi:hypothetical protein